MLWVCYEHNFIGAQIIGSGCGMTDIVADGGGTLATEAQVGLASGLLGDEDLEHPIATVASATGWHVIYNDGVAASTRQFIKTGYPLVLDTDLGAGSGIPVWNELTGGAWQTTPVPNGNWFWAHFFAIGTGSTGATSYVHMGTATYASLGAAEEAVDDEISGLIDTLPFNEKRAVGSVCFRYRSIYTNAVQAAVQSVFSGQDYYDTRKTGVTGSGGAGATDHQALTGRDAAGAHSGNCPRLANLTIDVVTYV